jgi:hypothetical protein
MDVQNDPFALDVMNHVINVIDSFSVNLEYKEKFSNLEIRDINTKQKGVFNTIKRTKWELLGEFEPVTVCKHQGKLGRGSYSQQNSNSIRHCYDMGFYARQNCKYLFFWRTRSGFIKNI